jgi:branched-chain amino acid transport system substrate-binding protein
MRFRPALYALLLNLALAVWPLAQAGAEEAIKIALIDPLSGGGALVGDQNLKTFQFVADEINAAGGIAGKKIEIVAFDNKANPQETLIQAQRAADQGIRFISQASGSANAAALIDFLGKYNDRNPGHEILYLNYGAIDPSLTNEKCSFWHFRFDADSDMKVSALVTFVKSQSKIKKIYLINQDYSFGQSFRKKAREALKEKRPDIEIVGDEVHPLLKVNDFSPYVAKIKASGADAVMTGNWGQDFALLIKAAADAGLNVDWFTLYGGLAGSPTGIKQTGLANRVFYVGAIAPNSGGAAALKLQSDFRTKFGFGLSALTAFTELHAFAQAVKQVKSEDVKAIATALEGMKMPGFQGGDLLIRKDDHQVFQDLYVASFGPLDATMKFEEDGTGWGWKTIATIEAEKTLEPTTCQMARP